ncbi:MAG: hypothetical protein P1U86_08640, partial [Verrucomicrobiales bacterium]|nr:hypothetical protein [Verrucomicrobiales bacterium]
MQRWKPDGVTPLEIWDLAIAGKNLWEWQDSLDYPELLLEALKRLREGSIESESKGAINPVARDFDSVFITGGRSQIPAIRAAIQKLDIPTCFGVNPIQGACIAAVETFRQSNESLLAIDVGQTQIKMVSREGSACFERNLAELPCAGDQETSSLPDQQKMLTAFISTSINQFLTETGCQPDKVLLALPCFIRPGFVLGGSSYLGMKEHPTLLRDLTTAPGLAGIPLLITNDAELAALPALSLPEFAKATKTL